MKKYDFIILGLYVVVFVVLLSIILDITYQEKAVRIKAKDYLEALYRKPVRTVVIKDTPLELTIRRGKLPHHLESGFELSGNMFFSNADCFKIQGDTLVVTGPAEQFGGVTLHLAPGVSLDTIVNAPHINQ